jgi:hypothetical protein
MGSDWNGEAVAAWEKAGVGVRQRKGGTVAAGAGMSTGSSSSFSEGMEEFVLRSMDERFLGSADIDELFTSSRQSGSWDVRVFQFSAVAYGHMCTCVDSKRETLSSPSVPSMPM